MTTDRETVQRIVGEELQKAGLDLNGEPLSGNDEDGYWPLALELRDTLTSALLAPDVLVDAASVRADALEEAAQIVEKLILELVRADVSIVTAAIRKAAKS